MKIGLKASQEVVAKDVNCSMNFGNVSMSDMILMYEAFSELAEADADLNHETSEWDLEVELEQAQTKDGEDPSDSDRWDRSRSNHDLHQYLVKWTDNTKCCEELVVKPESQDYHIMADSTDELRVGQHYLDRLWLKSL